VGTPGIAAGGLAWRGFCIDEALDASRMIGAGWDIADICREIDRTFAVH
jgi:hypothetical protein